MRLVALLILFVAAAVWPDSAAGQTPTQTGAAREHLVEPGDTWAALALRHGVQASLLHDLNRQINTAREPAVGSSILVPTGEAFRAGRIIRSGDGGLLATAARLNSNPWTIALANNVPTPYRPSQHQATYVPDEEGALRDLPPGFASMELSEVPARPGTAVAFRGRLAHPLPPTEATLAGNTVTVVQSKAGAVGLAGTGAFQPPGDVELRVAVSGQPLWSQPWRFVDRAWTFQQLTLTGEAAAIDSAAIAAERERLRAIWQQQMPDPLWQDTFAEPVENYLEISADYGGRRSYNGGPYASYHEGVDFSAYGGTPVVAPAAGRVVLAENLFVRGGAVIVDHGLGLFSGYYHLSAIHALPGQEVQPGDLLGEVGTTGLSTGNHLHWDLLVNGVWVDAAAWRAAGTDCWVLEGLGRPCPVPTP